MRVTSGSATDTGRRSANQDAVVVGHSIFAVADGMGGHASGDVAAGMVAEALRRLDESGAVTSDALLAAVQQVNDEIVAEGDRTPSRASMGTTLSGLALTDTGVVVVNVGDSRTYLVIDGRLEQVSHDHSAVQEMVDEGLMTREEARSAPHRNIITRSLGTLPAPEVDVVALPGASGRFLVCSDGLWEELTDAEIEEVLAAEAEPGRAAELLAARAVEAGGHDNVSVVVVDLEPDEPVAADG